MSDILTRILERKAEEVRALGKRYSDADLEELAAFYSRPLYAEYEFGTYPDEGTAGARPAYCSAAIAVICPASYTAICVPLGMPPVPEPATKCLVDRDNRERRWPRPPPPPAPPTPNGPGGMLLATLGGAIAGAGVAAAVAVFCVRHTRRRRRHVSETSELVITPHAF